jgi:hypothetical protein
VYELGSEKVHAWIGAGSLCIAWRKRSGDLSILCMAYWGQRVSYILPHVFMNATQSAVTVCDLLRLWSLALASPAPYTQPRYKFVTWLSWDGPKSRPKSEHKSNAVCWFEIPRNLQPQLWRHCRHSGTSGQLSRQGPVLSYNACDRLRCELGRHRVSHQCGVDDKREIYELLQADHFV